MSFTLRETHYYNNMSTIEEVESEIKSLKAKIACVESECDLFKSQCDSATSEERKDKLLTAFIESKKSLNALYAQLERLELRAQQQPQPQPGNPYLL